MNSNRYGYLVELLSDCDKIKIEDSIELVELIKVNNPVEVAILLINIINRSNP